MLRDIAIPRRDVKEYLGPEFFSALSLWRRTKRWGLPHGGFGWANEPEATMKILDLFEDETALHEAELKREKRGKKGENRDHH